MVRLIIEKTTPSVHHGHAATRSRITGPRASRQLSDYEIVLEEAPVENAEAIPVGPADTPPALFLTIGKRGEEVQMKGRTSSDRAQMQEKMRALEEEFFTAVATIYEREMGAGHVFQPERFVFFSMNNSILTFRRPDGTLFSVHAREGEIPTLSDMRNIVEDHGRYSLPVNASSVVSYMASLDAAPSILDQPQCYTPRLNSLSKQRFISADGKWNMATLEFFEHLAGNPLRLLIDDEEKERTFKGLTDMLTRAKALKRHLLAECRRMIGAKAAILENAAAPHDEILQIQSEKAHYEKTAMELMQLDQTALFVALYTYYETKDLSSIREIATKTQEIERRLAAYVQANSKNSYVGQVPLLGDAMYHAGSYFSFMKSAKDLQPEEMRYVKTAVQAGIFNIVAKNRLNQDLALTKDSCLESFVRALLQNDHFALVFRKEERPEAVQEFDDAVKTKMNETFPDVSMHAFERVDIHKRLNA